MLSSGLEVANLIEHNWSYPNSIRNLLFTEMAMETMNDSIKYIYPKYTKSQFEGLTEFHNPTDAGDNMEGALDDPTLLGDTDRAMYETTEDRYATELRDITPVVDTATKKVTLEFKNGPFGPSGEFYKNGFVRLFVVDKKTNQRVALAMQMENGSWVLTSGTVVNTNAAGTATVTIKAKTYTVEAANKFVIDLSDTTDAITGLSFKAVGRYDSERDLLGEYLGEVELQMRTYNFRPRPMTLGVTWTQMTELTLDSSFGLSAEEMLLDYASQEIKKTLDFQAVRYASNIQSVKAASNFVKFNAEAAALTNDSYYHTAQLINQPIARIKDVMLNKFNRGGVTAIVGGPAVTSYLSLNEHWSDRGAQVAIGGHKVGELNGKIRNAVVKVA